MNGINLLIKFYKKIFNIDDYKNLYYTIKNRIELEESKYWYMLSLIDEFDHDNIIHYVTLIKLELTQINNLPALNIKNIILYFKSFKFIFC